MRRVFVVREGEAIEVTNGSTKIESPFISTDTLDRPLTHPVTGKVFDSKSAFRDETRRQGCYEVGNDWIGKTPKRPVYNDIPEKRFRDACEKAESILSDPSKLRAAREENDRRAYEQERRLNRR